MTIEQLSRTDDSSLVGAHADTDSWVTIVADVAKLATHIADTEFVPKALRGKPAAVAAAMLSGREIGLPPMTAMQVTHVIEGKPGLSAEGMRALVFAAGHVIEFVESTGASCTIRGRRRFSETWTEVTWTLDMARAAKLAQRPIWNTYPRTQLQARATTELCRMIFPDVIHGFRSVEELEDMSGGESTDVSQPSATPSRAVSRRTKRAAPKQDSERAQLPAPTEVQRRTPPLPGEDGYDEAPLSQTEDVPPSSSGESQQGSGPAEASQLSESEPNRRRLISKPQLRMLHATWKRFELDGDEHRAERIGIVEQLIRRQIESTSELTNDETTAVLDTLGRLRDREALDAVITSVNKAEQEQEKTPEKGDTDDAPKE